MSEKRWPERSAHPRFGEIYSIFENDFGAAGMFCLDRHVRFFFLGIQTPIVGRVGKANQARNRSHHMLCPADIHVRIIFCNAQLCTGAAKDLLGQHTWTMTQHESALLCCATSPPFSVIVVGALISSIGVDKVWISGCRCKRFWFRERGRDERSSDRRRKRKKKKTSR